MCCCATAASGSCCSSSRSNGYRCVWRRDVPCQSYQQQRRQGTLQSIQCPALGVGKLMSRRHLLTNANAEVLAACSTVIRHEGSWAKLCVLLLAKAASAFGILR